MSSTIRMAVPDESFELKWPARCPGCKRNEGLIGSGTRVGKVRSVRPNVAGGFTVKSDVMRLDIPMCPQHARANSLAARLLEKSLLMQVIRAIVFLGLLMFILLSVSSTVGLISGNKTMAAGFRNLGGMLVLPCLGLIGTLVLIWARGAASARPVRWDPDVEVIELQFADARYAQTFSRLNESLTDATLTAAPPWYRRAALWKLLMVVGLIIFMIVLVKRAP